jgi:hypothetical protein
MVLGRAVAVAVAILLAAPALRSQSPPLPDQASFFAEVRKRLASNDLIQSRFSFRERTTELKLNPFGRMGTDGVKVYDVYPHPNDDLTYRRLIADDDRLLTARELADQDRRHREKLRAWHRRLEREGSSDRALREKREQEARERDQERASEALEVLTFTIERRDQWEGQPAIVLRFDPRPGARPRSREARIAGVFSGRVWIHETEFEVMYIDARATDDVSFGYGVIARLNEGSVARFTRRKIGGAWLPVRSEFTGTGRALLFRRIDIKFWREYSNYRPFVPEDLPSRLGWAP